MTFRRSEPLELYGIQRTRPYLLTGWWLDLGAGAEALLAFGQAAQRPFGTVSNDDKRRIGRRLAEVRRSR